MGEGVGGEGEVGGGRFELMPCINIFQCFFKELIFWQKVCGEGVIGLHKMLAQFLKELGMLGPLQCIVYMGKTFEGRGGGGGGGKTDTQTQTHKWTMRDR